MLTVTANGLTPFTYQWYRDGVAIAGATDSSYTIPAVSLADDGAGRGDGLALSGAVAEVVEDFRSHDGLA